MDTVYIDVREPHEYDSGHLSGAINIPVTRLGNHPDELNEIDKNVPIVVYCRSGARAEMAVQLLKNFGYKQIENGINQEQLQKNK